MSRKYGVYGRKRGEIMYAYIQGEITDICDNTIVVETAGIGYELFVSQNTLKNCKTGNSKRFYTYLSVREDGMSLFGFADKNEKNLFLKLIKVGGVGPKGAMDILGGMNANDLVSAIASGNSNLLCGIKGIGKKTAERIIVELKDKIGDAGYIQNEVITASSLNEVQEEAMNILIALGYKSDAAERAVVLAYKEGMTVNQTVHKAIGG